MLRVNEDITRKIRENTSSAHRADPRKKNRAGSMQSTICAKCRFRFTEEDHEGHPFKEADEKFKASSRRHHHR